MKRSAEITVLGWLYILEAGFTIIPLIFLIRYINFTENSQFTFLSAIIGIPLGVLGLIGGIGILKLFNWARKLLIMVAWGNIVALLIAPILGMVMIYGNLTLAHLNPGSYIATLVASRFTLLFFIVTIFYLLSPRIKEQFH